MTEQIQVVPSLAYARELLGVSEFSSKRTIKNAIYEHFHWSSTVLKTRRGEYEAAVAILLKYHEPSTTKEAKAVRAQEEADKKIRSQFINKIYLVKRAELLIIDVDLASTRRVLRTVYEGLTLKQKMSFIKIAGNVFNLTRREKAAIAKQDAGNKAKWDAQKTEREATQNALSAYYKEQNATKKAALWKTYLALTKPERDKKAAAKKAEEKRIADGLANVESVKVSNPEPWSQAVLAAAKATAISVLGRYFWGAQLHEGKGNANSYAGSSPDGVQKVQHIVIQMAGINAIHKLGVLPEGKYPGIVPDLNGYLDEFCKAGGLSVKQLVPELDGYAETLVDDNWDAILKVGTYLLATGSIKNSRTLRKVAGTEFQKPAFEFSPALATMGMLLPTTQPQPKAESILSPQQAAAIMAATRALVN